MNHFKILSDEAVEKQLKDLVAHEREILVQVLEHFGEVEARRIHLKKGYGSLFEYAVKELGYSDGSACRRIDTMRLSYDVPELTSKLMSGAVSLSNAAAVQRYLKRNMKSFSNAQKKQL